MNLSIRKLLFISSIIIFSSCSKDEDNGPAYEFLDQDLQGTIDGEAFVFGDGIVSSSDGELSFDLLSDMETESACEQFGFGDFVSVFFTIPEAEGIVELSLNLQSFEGQTVTMFNPETSLNVIATEGAVEITSITETSVSGKMDVKYDGENFVNGNFTAVFCD